MIRRLFVANRGEIARRVIRTAHAMGMTTAVAFAESDASAPFVAEAGTAVALAGRTAAETYLDQSALIEAARRVGADAIHPGYGFLSENASFARAVEGAGLVFVGPPPDAIEALGDKITAREAAAAAGVPVLMAAPDEHLVALPVIIKAAAGGGGKGMRIVRRREDLDDALGAARREARSAFGDERVFLEPYVERARHVEMQIFGDSHGNLVHCFERECSIQRRHQKVVEEAPSSVVDEELRETMGEAALRIAKVFGYTNAGTVEFLLAEDGRFFFLEVNTRLQVEHPVTEAITGLDLVREQLLVAEGEPLSFDQGDLRIEGHAIEARLYAEDPEHGYLPVAGTVELWRPATDPFVRVDSGIATGSVVGIEFDPMLAKVIAHAPSRREAAARLALALAGTSVLGLRTNRDQLISILGDEAFLAGDTTTAFLEERPVATRLRPARDDVRLAGVAAALAAEVASLAERRHLTSLPSGWRISAMPPQRRVFRVDGSDSDLAVDYARRRDGRYAVTVSDGAGENSESDHIVERRESGLVVDGLRPAIRVDRLAGNRTVVSFDDGAWVELHERSRFPEPETPESQGALVAPMPGTVLSVHADVGDVVETGTLLVVVEAMKMEHRITALFAGTVRAVHTAPGAQVASGDILVAIEAHETREHA